MERFKKQYVGQKSQLQSFPILRDALQFIRSITQKHTKELQPIISIDSSTESTTPAFQDLDPKILDRKTAKQYKIDIQKLKASQQWQPITAYSALGPFDQTFRICRDIRNSQATRQDKLLKAIRAQAAKAKANKADLSNVQGISVMKGAYI